MPHAPASAPAAERPARDLLAEYLAHLARTGRGHSRSEENARRFLKRWPDPGRWAAEPLAIRLNVDKNALSFVLFLLFHGHLHPGYDYLVRRKLTTFWR